MSHRSRGRRRRSWSWEGAVETVDEDVFTALLVPADHRGPDLVAEFDLAKMPQATPGLLFTLYTHRRGRKLRYVMRPRRRHTPRGNGGHLMQERC